MTTNEFKTKLKEFTNEDLSMRPFICDGNPLQSEIFIVGINPATKMDSSFWEYYKNESFDKKTWLKDYIKFREKSGKRTKLSPTRKKIENLVNNTLGEHLCLETNLFSKPSSNLNDLGIQNQQTDIFSFLIRTIKPKAILIHGANPAEFIKKELNVRFGIAKPIVAEYQTENRISPLEFEWEYGKIAICATRHFRLIRMEEIDIAAKGILKLIKK